MPKTKTQNNTEVNGKGKELDIIVNNIIKSCNDTIKEYKSGDTSNRRPSKTKNIDSWHIMIDNIPVLMGLNCEVNTLYDDNNKYKLRLERKLYWNGNLFIGENDTFSFCHKEIKVENDIIDKNDITKNIIKLIDINNLKYCKIQNRFIDKYSIFLNVVNYFGLKCENIDECCVCYDKTITRTKKCNHYLCLECVPKIKTFTPPNNMNYINCPMCKQRVNEINCEEVNAENVSDYDSNDED